MISIKNKVVWITGASSGIGEALAYKFAKAGARLIISARRADELERVKRNCSLAEDRILVMPLDVSDYQSIGMKSGEVINKFGAVDILVNNAGVSHWTKVKDLSLDVIHKIFNVNFFGGIALTKAVLPLMLANKRGHIVVISSVLGKMVVQKQAAYNASKHALHGFYDTLRLEVAPDGVGVLLVCPGFVRTNVAKNSLNKDGMAINQDNEKIAKGLDPDFVADKILKAIEKNKDEIIIAGAPEKSAIVLKRLAPSLFAGLMRKRKLL
ncbi:MAG: SDR family oxidoreductase [Cyclobacteriaceae bacterium]|nr:SDR family oxidoreductase [Cyclobacteriaceae bacterium]UYN85499.1 MAG: SDR family oxidoreductase [Cyclobacteriaceae bacterium]